MDNLFVEFISFILEKFSYFIYSKTKFQMKKFYFISFIYFFYIKSFTFNLSKKFSIIRKKILYITYTVHTNFKIRFFE